MELENGDLGGGNSGDPAETTRDGPRPEEPVYAPPWYILYGVDHPKTLEFI